MYRSWIALVVVSLALGSGCREEGAAEKAGRKLDEAVEELTHPDEGALEKLGRQADEALEEAKEAVDEAVEGE